MNQIYALRVHGFFCSFCNIILYAITHILTRSVVFGTGRSSALHKFSLPVSLPAASTPKYNLLICKAYVNSPRILHIVL